MTDQEKAASVDEGAFAVFFVMPGLVPGIHVFVRVIRKQGVDGRDKPSHDGAQQDGSGPSHELPAPRRIEREQPSPTPGEKPRGLSRRRCVFQRAFTIVLALALAEAFKQFIADKADKPEDRVIHWDRLPALLSFLFLAFPFFHGMSRYFFVTYIHTTTPPPHYAVYLMIDGIAFLFESAMFFVMSRTLSAGQWRRYYLSVLLLLAIDVAVGFHRVNSWKPYSLLAPIRCSFGRRTGSGVNFVPKQTTVTASAHHMRLHNICYDDA